MSTYLFTSESVTEGHPDKVCDKISDAVLDEILAQDPNGRVACETCCTTGMVMVMGEISTKAIINIPQIVRRTLNDIGYSDNMSGFNGNTCAILTSIDEQSADIAMGTNDEVGGAGDQGMMFGYACNETPDLMPLPISIANQMAYRLASVRKQNILPYILPDGKTQVTIEYDEDHTPIRVDTVVISTQHYASFSSKELVEPIKEYVITPVLHDLKHYQPKIDIDSYRLLVNPTGRFVKGGPAADSGLTGRKIIVDTYGGYAAHGGGAFSGKDPSKVDRSAAYAARYVAKNIVAAKLASRCQVQLAYAIGVAEPVSINIETYGTGRISDDKICEAVRILFDLTPKGIINELELRSPVYYDTAAYGHFGNTTGTEKSWERTTRASDLKQIVDMF